MENVDPIAPLVADTIAKLTQPGMTTAQAAAILAALEDEVHNNTLLGRLNEQQARTIATALSQALGVHEIYEPDAHTRDNQETGELESSPLLTIIEMMNLLGLPVLRFTLSDPDENMIEFLDAERPVEIEYDPENTTHPWEDVTDLRAEWLHKTLAAQAETDEEPGLYFRLTMPDTAWSFEREFPPGDKPTEAFFAFGEGYAVLASMIIYPNSAIVEHEDTIMVSDVDFVVRLYSMLDAVEGACVSRETHDRVLNVVSSIKLKTLIYDRMKRTIVGYDLEY